MYCRKQLRYAAKPQEKRVCGVHLTHVASRSMRPRSRAFLAGITHVVIVRDNFWGGTTGIGAGFDGLEYPCSQTKIGTATSTGGRSTESGREPSHAKALLHS